MEPLDIEDLYIRAGIWTATQLVKPLNGLMNHLLRVKQGRSQLQTTEPTETLETALTAGAKLAAALPIHARTVKAIGSANDTPEQAAIMDLFGPDVFSPLTNDSGTVPSFVPVIETNTARLKKATAIRRSSKLIEETKPAKSKKSAKTKKKSKSS